LDEMIWTFSQVNEDWEDQYHKEVDVTIFEKDKIFDIDKKGFKAHNKRMQNGFRLFGKYYSGLWD